MLRSSLKSFVRKTLTGYLKRIEKLKIGYYNVIHFIRNYQSFVRRVK
jgi:hypothetical protein